MKRRSKNSYIREMNNSNLAIIQLSKENFEYKKCIEINKAKMAKLDQRIRYIKRMLKR